MSGPSLRAIGDTVLLGKLLDTTVIGDAELLITASRASLLWSPATSSLLVFDGWKLGRPAAVRTSTKATKLYQRWTQGRPAEHERDLEVDKLPGERWASLGRAKTIGYRSDKFHERGVMTDYEHTFGRSVTLFCRRDETRAVLAWRGGNLRVTARGIEG
jgi:hypothetical protein